MRYELKHPKVQLLYEDEHLIVVNKERGFLTVATHSGATQQTVFSVLKAYQRRQNPRNGIYVVHRLDRETSGVLVWAKTPKMQQYMRTYWREIVTDRTYVALVEGILDQKEGQIRSWLTEDKQNYVTYSSPYDDGGQLAITNYKVIKECPASKHSTSPSLSGEGKGGAYSLVELHLETGRTNQIRVQLASIGHPVVGDRKYGHGNDNSPVDRLCLHAKVLEFIHPATEQVVRFESPVPKEFRKLLQ
ncbi:MAG: RluA family pseudouridine synthase [Paludibacteraceae bacterium]|nr:RluA family pseudouridine synthase [Paludibacteraceae bacterium]